MQTQPIDLKQPQYLSQALALINKDRLPGQPECSQDMLLQAIRGSSDIDGKFWDELEWLEHIAVKEDENLLGVAAVGKRKDNTGVLLWMHHIDVSDVMDALLDSVEEKLSNCDQQEAFSHASALSLGMEALPHRRKAIHEALLKRGYKGEDSWLYMHGALSDPTDIFVNVEATKENDLKTFKLTLVEEGKEASSSTVAVSKEGIGVIWWIETKPEFRRKGLGRIMLRQAQSVLVESGANEVILFVDHDDPDDPERSRDAAIKLYLSEGLKIEDHLWSYKKKGDQDV